jgi:benzoyl-CoA-dihydrodiol lyase
VPLLGVLPGTGGLTRVTDKRHVRHDLADIFCTSVRRRARPARGGLAAGRCDFAKPQQFNDTVAQRASELAAQSRPPGAAKAWRSRRSSAR